MAEPLTETTDRPLGHHFPLGLSQPLGGALQPQALGGRSLSILDLTAFFPFGFPDLEALPPAEASTESPQASGSPSSTAQVQRSVETVVPFTTTTNSLSQPQARETTIAPLSRQPEAIARVEAPQAPATSQPHQQPSSPATSHLAVSPSETSFQRLSTTHSDDFHTEATSPLTSDTVTTPAERIRRSPETTASPSSPSLSPSLSPPVPGDSPSTATGSSIPSSATIGRSPELKTPAIPSHPSGELETSSVASKPSLQPSELHASTTGQSSIFDLSSPPAKIPPEDNSLTIAKVSPALPEPLARSPELSPTPSPSPPTTQPMAAEDVRGQPLSNPVMSDPVISDPVTATAVPKDFIPEQSSTASTQDLRSLTPERTSGAFPHSQTLTGQPPHAPSSPGTESIGSKSTPDPATASRPSEDVKPTVTSIEADLDSSKIQRSPAHSSMAPTTFEGRAIATSTTENTPHSGPTPFPSTLSEADPTVSKPEQSEAVTASSAPAVSSTETVSTPASETTQVASISPASEPTARASELTQEPGGPFATSEPTTSRNTGTEAIHKPSSPSAISGSSQQIYPAASEQAHPGDGQPQLSPDLLSETAAAPSSTPPTTTQHVLSPFTAPLSASTEQISRAIAPPPPPSSLTDTPKHVSTPDNASPTTHQDPSASASEATSVIDKSVLQARVPESSQPTDHSPSPTTSSSANGSELIAASDGSNAATAGKFVPPEVPRISIPNSTSTSSPDLETALDSLGSASPASSNTDATSEIKLSQSAEEAPGVLNELRRSPDHSYHFASQSDPPKIDHDQFAESSGQSSPHSSQVSPDSTHPEHLPSTHPGNFSHLSESSSRESLKSSSETQSLSSVSLSAQSETHSSPEIARKIESDKIKLTEQTFASNISLDQTPDKLALGSSSAESFISTSDTSKLSDPINPINPINSIASESDSIAAISQSSDVHPSPKTPDISRRTNDLENSHNPLTTGASNLFLGQLEGQAESTQGGLISHFSLANLGAVEAIANEQDEIAKFSSKEPSLKGNISEGVDVSLTTKSSFAESDQQTINRSLAEPIPSASRGNTESSAEIQELQGLATPQSPKDQPYPSDTVLSSTQASISTFSEPFTISSSTSETGEVVSDESNLPSAKEALSPSKVPHSSTAARNSGLLLDTESSPSIQASEDTSSPSLSELTSSAVPSNSEPTTHPVTEQDLRPLAETGFSSAESTGQAAHSSESSSEPQIPHKHRETAASSYLVSTTQTENTRYVQHSAETASLTSEPDSLRLASEATKASTPLQSSLNTAQGEDKSDESDLPLLADDVIQPSLQQISRELDRSSHSQEAENYQGKTTSQLSSPEQLSSSKSSERNSVEPLNPVSQGILPTASSHTTSAPEASSFVSDIEIGSLYPATESLLSEHISKESDPSAATTEAAPDWLLSKTAIAPTTTPTSTANRSTLPAPGVIDTSNIQASSVTDVNEAGQPGADVPPIQEHGLEQLLRTADPGISPSSPSLPPGSDSPGKDDNISTGSEEKSNDRSPIQSDRPFPPSKPVLSVTPSSSEATSTETPQSLWADLPVVMRSPEPSQVEHSEDIHPSSLPVDNKDPQSSFQRAAFLPQDLPNDSVQRQTHDATSPDSASINDGPQAPSTLPQQLSPTTPEAFSEVPPAAEASFLPQLEHREASINEPSHSQEIPLPANHRDDRPSIAKPATHVESSRADQPLMANEEQIPSSLPNPASFSGELPFQGNRSEGKADLEELGRSPTTLPPTPIQASDQNHNFTKNLEGQHQAVSVSSVPAGPFPIQPKNSQNSAPASHVPPLATEDAKSEHLGTLQSISMLKPLISSQTLLRKPSPEAISDQLLDREVTPVPASSATSPSAKASLPPSLDRTALPSQWSSLADLMAAQNSVAAQPTLPSHHPANEPKTPDIQHQKSLTSNSYQSLEAKPTTVASPQRRLSVAKHQPTPSPARETHTHLQAQFGSMTTPFSDGLIQADPDTPMTSVTANTSPPVSTQALEHLVQEVYYLLCQRLAVEQERHGRIYPKRFS